MDAICMVQNDKSNQKFFKVQKKKIKRKKKKKGGKNPRKNQEK